MLPFPFAVPTKKTCKVWKEWAQCSVKLELERGVSGTSLTKKRLASKCQKGAIGVSLKGVGAPRDRECLWRHTDLHSPYSSLPLGAFFHIPFLNYSFLLFFSGLHYLQVLLILFSFSHSKFLLIKNEPPAFSVLNSRSHAHPIVKPYSSAPLEKYSPLN